MGKLFQKLSSVFPRNKAGEEEVYVLYKEDDYLDPDVYEQSLPGTRKSVPVGVIAFLVFWAVFILIGVFSTTYRDGEPEIVTPALRAERVYMKQMVKAVDYSKQAADRIAAVNQALAEGTTDIFTASTEYQALYDALDKLMGEIKTTRAPNRLAPFHGSVIGALNYQGMTLQEIIQYCQDRDQVRLERIDGFWQQYVRAFGLVQEQMKAINRQIGISL